MESREAGRVGLEGPCVLPVHEAGPRPLPPRGSERAGRGDPRDPGGVSTQAQD